ncbi:MAG: transglutaminase family protein [bacterium]
MLSNEELTARIVSAAQARDSELELAVWVAQLIMPADDPAEFFDEIHAATGALAERVDRSQGDIGQQVLATLTQAGFGQQDQSEQAVTAQHSHIGWVLAHRRGIPISLAVILIAVARQCGLSAWGVNYPGHFLVHVQDRLVDPLTLRFLDEAQLLQRDTTSADLRRQLLPATPQGFVLRMLNNLKALQMNQQLWTGVLDLIDVQSAVSAADDDLIATLEYERGQCWVQLGAYAVASQAFARCAEKTTAPELARQALEKVEQLGQRREVLH